MILHLNTSNLNSIDFKLLEERKVVTEKTISIPYQEKGDILKHLDKFLTENNAATKKDSPNLAAIQLYAGPGSHTGLRVGSAIAQALSLAWGIPYKTTKRAI